ncbi:MAG TPA: tetratricopeptide repeat protein [Candidatus Eisenbacteria bacterium]|nr:tetratricopeptide repeat protein [Candidatus Eisenbacteria bacterium]
MTSSRILELCGLLLVAGILVPAQTAQPTSPQDSSSRAQPDQPPTPPDAPAPDLRQQISPPPKSKAKKIVNKLDPHCIDVIFHSCWSSPAAPPGKVLTEEEQKAQQAATDIDVGYYYLNEKNYVAAESRLKEAVELKPDAAAAYIGLAQAQQKRGKTAEARASYEAYLMLEPEGHDAEKVKKALAELK